jgi:vacuolar-type H+-ATPase subunit C/Vma6
MDVRLTTGLDYVAAVLHGRRSRMAEGDRLGALAAERSIGDLARVLYGETAIASAVELQKRLVVDRALEILELARKLDGPAGEFLDWLAVRFQVENLKVLARGLAAGTPWSEVQAHLVPLPGNLAVDARAMASEATVETLAGVIRQKPLAGALVAALPLYQAYPRAYVLESALDRGYFVELLARAGAVAGEDLPDVLALVKQEIDIFHLVLAVRGKFFYGLPAEQLAPFYVAGARLRRPDFSAMLTATDLAEAAGRAVGFVIDAAPEAADPAALERLAWDRYHRLAAAVFRRSPAGLGLVAAYVALRRVELANLITASEGIRAGLSADDLRRRMIPRPEAETRRV